MGSPPKGSRPPRAVETPIARATRPHGGEVNVSPPATPATALARIMGTSVRMIERHYGVLLEGAMESIAARLDAYEAQG